MTIRTLLSGSSRRANTALSLLTSNFDIIEENGEIILLFRTNMGKGSGPQKVALNEVPRFVQALQNAVDGNQTSGRAEYIPADQMVARTFGTKTVVVDGVEIECYTWNGRQGKESKPARVAVGEMGAVLDFLRSKVEELAPKCVELGLLTAEQAALPWAPEVEAGESADADTPDDDIEIGD